MTSIVLWFRIELSKKLSVKGKYSVIQHCYNSELKIFCLVPTPNISLALCRALREHKLAAIPFGLSSLSASGGAQGKASEQDSCLTLSSSRALLIKTEIALCEHVCVRVSVCLCVCVHLLVACSCIVVARVCLSRLMLILLTQMTKTL